MACAGALLGGSGLKAVAQEKQAEPPAAITLPPDFRAASFEMVGNKIVLRVRLNGKVAGNVALDTGANTCLVPRIATDLGVKLEPYPDAGPKSKYGEIASLAIGSVKLEKVGVEFTPLPFIDAWNKEHPQSKLIGLLGRDALEAGALGLDFVSHTLGWWPGGKLSPELARSFNSLLHLPNDPPGVNRIILPGSSVTINNTVVANPPMAPGMPQTLPLYTKQEDGYWLLKVALDNIPAELVLDTGSDSSMVSEAVGAKLHPLFSIATKIHGVDNETSGTTMLLRSLTLGSVAFDFPAIAVVHPPKSKGELILLDTPVLGMDVLTNCRILMDFPGKTLYVSPYADFNHTPSRALRRLGMLITRESNHFSILALFAGYPAAQAGIKVGDELLDVNGVPGEKWLSDIDRMQTDTTLTLHVRRKGMVEPLTFALALPTSTSANNQETTPTTTTALVPVKHYNPGDVILFPDGGQIIIPGNPPTTLTILPGRSYVYPGMNVTVIFYSPGK